jgi:hypothetical protein
MPKFVFDTFPWPQLEVSREERQKREEKGKEPLRSSRSLREIIEQIRAVAEAALALRALRHEIMSANGWSLRELYKSLETPVVPFLSAAWPASCLSPPI